MPIRPILLALWAGALAAQPLPVRGIHLAAPKAAEIPLAVKFIRQALPKEGVNVLVLEINYHYKFTRRREVVEPDSLSRDEVRQIVEACRAAGVRLIPQINLLDHQSWAKTSARAAGTRARRTCSRTRSGSSLRTWPNRSARCGCGATASWMAKRPA